MIKHEIIVIILVAALFHECVKGFGVSYSPTFRGVNCNPRTHIYNNLKTDINQTPKERAMTEPGLTSRISVGNICNLTKSSFC